MPKPQNRMNAQFAVLDTDFDDGAEETVVFLNDIVRHGSALSVQPYQKTLTKGQMDPWAYLDRPRRQQPVIKDRAPLPPLPEFWRRTPHYPEVSDPKDDYRTLSFDEAWAAACEDAWRFKHADLPNAWIAKRLRVHPDVVPSMIEQGANIMAAKT